MLSNIWDSLISTKVCEITTYIILSISEQISTYMKCQQSLPLLCTSRAYTGGNTLPLLPAQNVHAVPEDSVEKHTSSTYKVIGEGINWINLKLEEREGGREREEGGRE